MSTRDVTGKMRQLKDLFLLGLALTVLTCLLSLYFLTISQMASHPAGSDFAKFYYSTRYLLEGKDIYQEVPLDLFGLEAENSDRPRDSLHPNLNPPFVSLLLAPASFFSYTSAYVGWAVLSLVLGLLAIHQIQKTLFPNLSSPRKIAGFVLLLAYFPTWISIIYGQFSLLLLFLLASAWSELRKSRHSGAGIFLGLAVSIKLFAALYLLFLLIRRQWRSLAWALGTLSACILGALAVLGPKAYERYFQILGEINWHSASWNASFLGFFRRIFGGSQNVPLIPSPETGQLLAWGCSLFLLTALMVFARRGIRDVSPSSLDVGFALFGASMLLLSPLGWMYYFPVLWLGYAVGWHWRRASSSRWILFLLISSWVLGNLPHLLIPSREVQGSWEILALSGSYFYALVLSILALMTFCPGRTGPVRNAARPS